MKELDFASIGRRIRETRIEKKLTQEYISDYASVNVSHISNIENGRVKVSLTLLVSICNALDCTVDYILANEHPASSATVLERELLHSIKDMDTFKKEQLLRISKVL